MSIRKDDVDQRQSNQNQAKMEMEPSQGEEGHYTAGENCLGTTNAKVVGKWRQQKSKTVPESILEMFLFAIFN